jgi:hypothetical protein
MGLEVGVDDVAELDDELELLAELLLVALEVEDVDIDPLLLDTELELDTEPEEETLEAELVAPPSAAALLPAIFLPPVHAPSASSRIKTAEYLGNIRNSMSNNGFIRDCAQMANCMSSMHLM